MKEQFIITNRAGRVVGHQLAASKGRARYLFAAKLGLSESNLKAVTYREFEPPSHAAHCAFCEHDPAVCADGGLCQMRRDDDSRSEFMMLHGTE